MTDIIEYKYQGKPAFKGMVKCPKCGDDYKIDTVDKQLTITPPQCFECFMNGEKLGGGG